MFCPKCQVEYRTGFIRCSDCEVDLVEELPKEGPPFDGAFTLLWECADQTECVGVCRDLKNADIPYQVDQIPYERTVGMRVERRYRILISPNDLDRAKELLGIDAPQNTIPSSDDDDEEVPKMLPSRCGLKTATTFPPALSSPLTRTAFIAAAIPINLVPRKSLYGPKTNPSPVKSSAKSSRALLFSS